MKKVLTKRMIKMANINLLRCNKCGRSLIAEELELHECKRVVDYKNRERYSLA
jgi:hypothetical protein